MFGTYRTLLALMVVALHLGGVPVIGSYAVFGFYMLSGFLMTLIMQENYGYEGSGIYRYAINRFLRIYPIYWVSIGLSLILINILGERFTAEYHGAILLPDNALEWFKNITLFFPFRDFPRLTPPAWALTVEIFFYILIGLGLSKSRKVTLLWFVVSVGFHVYAVVNGFTYGQRYYSVAAASLPFATGALVYHLKLWITDHVLFFNSSLAAYVPLVVFAAILLNWYIGYLLDLSRGIFFYTNYVLCSVMVISLLGSSRLPFISRSFDSWIGNFSYPIYLIHYQVGLLVIVGFQFFGYEISRPSLTLMAVSIPAILIISYVVVITIEQPIERLRKRFKG